MSEAELVRRLEELERDNRRLKRFVVAGLAVAAAFCAVYASRPVPQTITAHEFDVVDSSGKVRESLYTVGGEPDIDLLDAQGIPRAAMLLDKSGLPLFGLNDAQGTSRVLMSLDGSGSPEIELSDSQGFTMDLGSTSTVTLTTGETQRTSADSIVMFGNGAQHHVIWQAP